MTHVAWRGLAYAHNLSFAGATVEELELFIRQTHAFAGLQRVVIGLDFFSFNQHVGMPPQFRDALAGMREPFASYQPYFTWKMLWLAVYTVLQQDQLDPYHLPSGQSDPAYYEKWLTTSRAIAGFSCSANLALSVACYPSRSCATSSKKATRLHRLNICGALPLSRTTKGSSYGCFSLPSTRACSK